MITDSQLQQIMPTLPAAKRQMYLPFLNHALDMFDINTPLRQAAFLAQIAHESGELKFWEEIWGPTAAQKRYEPPSDLATRLGNTQPGDGKRYKGRGPIQITGRFNYRKYGQLLAVDLENNPDLASTTQIGFETAGQFWKLNGLNQLADAQDFTSITKRINGGLNGLASRQKYYERAKQVLGVAASFSSFSVAAAVSPQSVAAAPFALLRGQEAIEEDSNAVPTSTPTPVSTPTPKPPSNSGTSNAAAKKKSAAQLAKKAVRVGVKSTKPAKKAAKKVAKKAAKKVAKKASKKAAKPVAKKKAKPAAKKVAQKAAKKVVKKAPTNKAAKKATAKPAKKTAKKAAKKATKKK